MDIKNLIKGSLGKIALVLLAAGVINWLLIEFVAKTPTVRQFDAAAEQSKNIANESAKVASPSVSPSPKDLEVEAQRREAKKIIARLDKIKLQHDELQEKTEQEYQQRKACILEKEVADFHPNDENVQSPECKKILAN